MGDDPGSKPQMTSVEHRYEMMMRELSERNETQIRFFRWAASLGFTLVVIAGGVLAFVFNGSLNAIRVELREAVTIYVNSVITEGTQGFKDIEELSSSFRRATEDLAELQATLERLSFFETATGPVDEVPPAIYARLSELEDGFWGESATDGVDRPADEQYFEAAVLLQRAIDAGLQESMDPNEVFNSGIIASRMGFEAEAAKLRTIAFSLRPTPDHRATMLASEDMFGIRYRIESGVLVRDDAPRETVRSEAWNSMLLLVGSAGMESQTQVYSQAANMAERNRALGYTQELAERLESVTTDRPDLVTAYTYAILADLETRSGGTGWREAFRHYQGMSIALLAEESPNAPIYDPTVRNLLSRANFVGELNEVIEALRGAGVDLSRVLP